MSERTLTIIKPDSVENGNIGNIIAHLEREGFHVAAARMTHLTTAQAETFYAVHSERPFYNDLVAYMTSSISSRVSGSSRCSVFFNSSRRVANRSSGLSGIDFSIEAMVASTCQV